MTHSSVNDDVLFDRLVDGELSAIERERLLTSLDDRADGWRRCALAFLEAQSWRRQMKKLVAAPFQKRVQPSQVTLAGGWLGHKGVSWLALAAGLMLAFTVGRWARLPSSGGDVNRQLADVTVEENAVKQNVSPEDIAKNVGPNDAVTLLVRDDKGRQQRLRVPLVDSAGLDDQLGTMLTSLPPGYRDNLQERGLDLRGRRRYAPLYFEQNEQLVPMVVPVDDAYVVPVSRPVY